jgi:hypothetical protein
MTTPTIHAQVEDAKARTAQLKEVVPTLEPGTTEVEQAITELLRLRDDLDRLAAEVRRPQDEVDKRHAWTAPPLSLRAGPIIFRPSPSRKVHLTVGGAV